MIFGQHTMSMVTDPNIIGPEINNKDFVVIACVSNTDSMPSKYPNVYDACILMPPTELLMAWADGNMLAISNGYPNYLMNNKDADDMIVALLTALTKKNVILYIPRDEYSIFGQVLLNHIYYVYGITMNTPNTIFSFDESKLPFLISKFYMMDLMEPMDYIASYPPTALLPQFVINKLAEDLRPFDFPATFQQYADYFNNMVRQSKEIPEVVLAKRV